MVTLVDLSTFGTRLNGAKMTPRTETPVPDGSIIMLGGPTLTLQ